MTEAGTKDQRHPTWKCPVWQFPRGTVPHAYVVDDSNGRWLFLNDKGYEMPRDWIMNRINPLTLETEIYVGPWYKDKIQYAEGYWVNLEMIKAIINF